MVNEMSIHDPDFDMKNPEHITHKQHKKLLCSAKKQNISSDVVYEYISCYDHAVEMHKNHIETSGLIEGIIGYLVAHSIKILNESEYQWDIYKKMGGTDHG